MTHPKEKVRELQAIQDQIIAFIQTYTENGQDDKLAHSLRQAVSDLSRAKGIIVDRAEMEGTWQFSAFGLPRTE